MAARKKKREKPDAKHEADIAHGPSETIEGASIELEAEVARLARPYISYTREEAEKQEIYVSDLLVQGADSNMIYRLCRAQWPRFTHRRARVIVERIHAFWKRDKPLLEERREAQVRMVRRWAMQAAGERDSNGKWITKPDHKALAAYGTLLMKLEGTSQAPAKVEVHSHVHATYNQALATTIMQMTPEQAESLLDEARETERLAKIAKDMFPALGPASTEG